MNKKYYLLSGIVQSGKTTSLINWAKGKNADGIVAPIINRVRHLQYISSGLKRELEIKKGNENIKTISVGRFLFDEDVFAWGRKNLLKSFLNNPEWLIIDEIGPLELRGEGLEPAVSKILNRINDKTKTKIIFVVREKLVESFLQFYNLNREEINFITIN
ncbi:MAG: nucleoside-triphosphatase, partial [Ignavibacteriaceae bacterium]